MVKGNYRIFHSIHNHGDTVSQNKLLFIFMSVSFCRIIISMVFSLLVHLFKRIIVSWFRILEGGEKPNTTGEFKTSCSSEIIKDKAKEPADIFR